MGELAAEGLDGPGLDQKILSALKSRLIPDKGTESLIETVHENDDIERLFRQMAESPHLRRLLFLQPADLFLTENEVSLPFFYLGKVRSGSQAGGPAESTGLGHVVRMEMEAAQQKRLALKRLFGLSDEELEQSISDLTEISIWLLVRVLEEHPELLNLARKGGADYGEIMSVVGDPSKFADEAEEKIESVFGEDEGLDPAIRSRIENLVVRFVPGLFEALEQTGPASAPVPDLASGLHQRCSEWVPGMLEKAELEFEEYVASLDELYRYDAIETRDVIHWCESCSLNTTAYGKQYGQIAPSHLQRQQCLGCERPSSYSGLFTPTSEFRDVLFAEDGLLGIYVGWLLTNLDVHTSISDHESGREIDFIVDGRVLIECKMRRQDRDNQQVTSSLGNALNQIEEQIESLEENGRSIEKAVYVWNRWDEPYQYLRTLQSKHQALFSEYDLEIINPDQLDDLVEAVQGNE